LTHVHLVGIGGSGLSAIARILHERGFLVSGSDRAPSAFTSALQGMGIFIYPSHVATNVHGADLVVRSSAIPDDNPEVVEAKRLGIPVLKRAELMDMLLDGFRCIAVAGTHGKTTTSAMISWILKEVGRDPSYIIGGISLNLANNAGNGSGKDFVIEADEYDRMFLGLKPFIAVITNIEYDHPDCYPTPEEYFQAFSVFVQGLQVGGLLVACKDDQGVANLLSKIDQTGLRVQPYKLSDAEFLGHQEGTTHFIYKGIEFSLQLPGFHNVRNALAALKVVEELGIPLHQAVGALEKFRGTARRFEVKGEVGGIVIIDDYAHHPTEIQATLDAARMRYPGRRTIVVWQPHTYSRTQKLFHEFVEAFSAADLVVVTEVYAARENLPEDGLSARTIAEAISAAKTKPSSGQAYFLPTRDQARNFLLEQLVPGDVLMVLSAGDADLISSEIYTILQKTRQKI
jgi:UDP-N-acetylmuramate--alanine ligase